jgi:dolichol-phosphate mannosyltransferase
MKNKHVLKEISIVIPVYNEEDVLPVFIQALEKAAVDSFKNYEIVIVDDGSTDLTKSFLKKLIKNKKYKILGFRCNQGQSAAIHHGVGNARYEVVATLDADGQNDPGDIINLASNLKEGRAVCGFRTRRKDYFIRKFFSIVARKLLNLAGGIKVLDPGCTLKVFYKEDFLRLPFFNGMHRFIPYLFHQNGIELIQKEVNHRPRLAGKSKYKLWSRTFRVAFDIFGLFWLRKRAIPYYKVIK